MCHPGLRRRLFDLPPDHTPDMPGPRAAKLIEWLRCQHRPHPARQIISQCQVADPQARASRRGATGLEPAIFGEAGSRNVSMGAHRRCGPTTREGGLSHA